MERNFWDMIRARWAKGLFVCVGLDSELEKIPAAVCRDGGIDERFKSFNCQLITATADLACAYKPNMAFYECHGTPGIRALKETIAGIKALAPRVPVILDFKRADIGNTNLGSVAMAFEFLKADAVTVNPYLGQEALKPFLDQKDKGIIVLCRTSNKGAGEFQDLEVRSRDHLSHLHPEDDKWRPLYQHVATRVANHWNQNGNCGLVVGATYPEELAQVRKIVGDLPILIPGIGAQGGDVEKTVTAGQDSRGEGMIINSSRGIIFASSGDDFAAAARRETQRLTDLINQFRKKGG